MNASPRSGSQTVTPFPALTRGRLETLQLNLGYRCNQACAHCHVEAGPLRTEAMSAEVADLALQFAIASSVKTLDLTGGAPELNPVFRQLVRNARRAGIAVIDRCNLTILEEPGQADLAQFLAGEGCRVVASLPCYGPENVEAQRGKGVFDASIRGIKALNALGYAAERSGLVLDLVYNPVGAHLPPAQAAQLWLDSRGQRRGAVRKRKAWFANKHKRSALGSHTPAWRGGGGGGGGGM